MFKNMNTNEQFRTFSCNISRYAMQFRSSGIKRALRVSFNELH